MTRVFFHSSLTVFFLIAGATLAVFLPVELEKRAGDPLAAVAAAEEMLGEELPELLPSRASFTLRFRDVVSDHRIASAVLMPGETLDIEVVTAPPGNAYSAAAQEGRLRPIAPGRWAWTAPQYPGHYSILVSESASGESVTLTAFVMVPFKHTTISFNGYKIGSYPVRPLKNKPIYLRPRGFIEVTETNQDTFVSPHFRLSQFLCKQEGTFPKYLVLNTRLLMKLELIIDELNRRGYGVETLHVMSGYRTPAYNAAIKNVRYSLHQWGYAADVFVDRDGDGMMDDLNQDGIVDQQDAAILSDIVEELDRDKRFRSLAGGLGQYEKNHFHGPFVHVDVRGWDARWGVRVEQPLKVSIRR
jgi:hypothetical protein